MLPANGPKKPAIVVTERMNVFLVLENAVYGGGGTETAPELSSGIFSTSCLLGGMSGLGFGLLSSEGASFCNSSMAML